MEKNPTSKFISHAAGFVFAVVCTVCVVHVISIKEISSNTALSVGFLIWGAVLLLDAWTLVSGFKKVFIDDPPITVLLIKDDVAGNKTLNLAILTCQKNFYEKKCLVYFNRDNLPRCEISLDKWLLDHSYNLLEHIENEKFIEIRAEQYGRKVFVVLNRESESIHIQCGTSWKNAFPNLAAL